MSVFSIAEVAGCHDGDITKALRLIEQAKRIGADAVKVQWTSDPKRLAERRHVTDPSIYRYIAFPRWWLDTLKAACCAGVGIEFMCTVYLPEDISAVAAHISRFKVASFEARDHEFIKAHQPYGWEVIISTGMNPYGLDWNEMFDLDDELEMRTRYLHCVSGYPTPIDQINLRVIHDGYYDGLSDHTGHMFTGGLAVAAGAEIIEFHMRLDDTDVSNPDYSVSLNPHDAETYVEWIRRAEMMMGDGVKKVEQSEEKNLQYRVGV